MAVLERIAVLITKLFPFWLILFSGVAFIYPDTLKTQGSLVTYLLGIIMLGMGLSMQSTILNWYSQDPRTLLSASCCGILSCR